MTSAKQTNTIEGDLVATASGAITEGYLVKITTDTSDNKLRVILPTDVADVTPYVALETVADGVACAVRPLSPNRNVRVVADGAIVAGVEVYLSGTFGKVVTSTGAGSDTYWAPGIAETDAASGGLVLIRPVGRTVTV
jgi:hypothetical protein